MPRKISSHIDNSFDWENYLQIINQVISSFPGPAYIKDIHGFYIFCNEPFAKKSRLGSIKNVLGKTDTDMPWNDKETTQIDKEVIHFNRPAEYETSEGFFYKKPLYNQNQSIIGLLCIECPKSNIEKSYHTLREIVSIMPGHVYWKNREGTLLGCNIQQANDIGLKSVDEIHGKKLYDFIYANQPAQEPVNRLLGQKTNIHLIQPVDYLAFIYLMKRAALILTDSGGVQEEAPSLGKPVLVLRDTTERPEAIHAGTARLTGTNVEAIVSQTALLLTNANEYAQMAQAQNPYGNGHAADKIINIILQKYGQGVFSPQEAHANG